MTVAEKTVSLLGVDFKSYYVSSVTVYFNESCGSSGSGSGTCPQTWTFTVHFKNTKNWSKVCMYVYKDNKPVFAEWPGTEMTYNEAEGYYVSSFDVTGTGTYNYVFNKGTGGPAGEAQTNDLTSIP